MGENLYSLRKNKNLRLATIEVYFSLMHDQKWWEKDWGVLHTIIQGPRFMQLCHQKVAFKAA